MLLVCDVGGGTTVSCLLLGICLWLLIRKYLGLECSPSYEYRRHWVAELGANGRRTGYLRYIPFIGSITSNPS